VVASLGGAAGGNLALVVERALAAHGREHDRARIFHAENVGRHVDLADVDEPARTQLELEEALAVGAQRDFVVDTRGHVAEMRGRDVLAADRLEIEDVDRLLGRLDGLVRAHRRPHQRIGELGPRREAFAGEGFEPAGGEQRTSGQELQELAPAGGAVGKRRHGEPSLKSDGPALELFRLACARHSVHPTRRTPRNNRVEVRSIRGTR
jgi:hypothetical protein